MVIINIWSYIPLQGDFDYERFCSVMYKPKQAGVISEAIWYETNGHKEIVYTYLEFQMGTETTEVLLHNRGFIGDPGPEGPMQNLNDKMDLVCMGTNLL